MKSSFERIRSWWSVTFERRLDHGRTSDLGLDSGMSLIEVLVSFLITAILLTVTVPTLSTFVTATDNVQSTYTALDQILPLSTTLPRYLRSAVEPAPDAAGVPVPPFGVFTSAAMLTNYGSSTSNYGPYSLQFYSNIGDVNGPELINVTMTGTSAPYTLLMTGTPANAGTCPGINVGATACTYTPSKARIFSKVTNLVNGPGSGTPIFTFETAAQVALAQNSTPFLTTNCGASACPPDDINYVTINLTGLVRSGQPTTITSSVYLLVSAYSAIVG
jgi:hypothetical protein